MLKFSENRADITYKKINNSNRLTRKSEHGDPARKSVGTDLA